MLKGNMFVTEKGSQVAEEKGKEAKKIVLECVENPKINWIFIATTEDGNALGVCNAPHANDIPALGSMLEEMNQKLKDAFLKGIMKGENKCI